MKVIEGNFGKTGEEAVSASDMLQQLTDYGSELEDEGVQPKLACVMFIQGVMLQVLSNETYPDGAYTLLNMGSDSVMNEILGGGE